MVEVPTTDDVTDAGSSGVTGGLPAGAGVFIGKSLLGGTLGTAIGGIAGASLTDGNTRDRTAETSVILAASEAAGSGGLLGSSNNDGGGRGRM